MAPMLVLALRPFLPFSGANTVLAHLMTLSHFQSTDDSTHKQDYSMNIAMSIVEFKEY